MVDINLPITESITRSETERLIDSATQSLPAFDMSKVYPNAVPIWNGRNWVPGNPGTGIPSSTTIPASAQMDTEFVYQGNGFKWSFKYNPASSSAYKWEFVGGAPFMTFVVGAIASSLANTWQDTVTPNFTFPFAGDYECHGSVKMLNTPAAALSPAMGFILNGAGVPGLFGQVTTTTVAWLETIVTTIPVTGVAAGAVLSQAVFTQNVAPANTSWSERIISVRPIRIQGN